MRVVHLANFHGPRSGGLRTMMRQLAREYSARGIDIEHVVPGPRNRTLEIEGTVTHEVASPIVPRSGGYRMILDVPRALRVLEAARPDVVEISDRLTLLRAAAWARQHDARSVMFAHERIDGVIRANARRLPATRIADAMNRHALARVDHIVATTEFASEEFRRIGHEPHVVPLAYEDDRFGTHRRTVRGIPLQERSMRLVMCSRLSYEKACHLAVDAVRVGHANGMPVHLDVLGDGPLRDALEARASGLPVTFHGFVGDRDVVAHMLANADVVLAPGPIETFGLAALEALGSGTPVVANRASAIPELLGDAGATAGEDATEWWEAAHALVLAGDAARERARRTAARYSWSATADQLLGIYTQ